MERPDNDVVAGGREPVGRRKAGGSRVAVVISTVATCLALGLFALIAAGVIGSEQTSNSREVQRP
jgi:hypothetical protein